MGVSGAGKGTVASALAGRFGLAYVDGDDLHPPANVVKMRSGVPLDDVDRWPWLDMAAAALRSSVGVVLACSAPKRACRDRIRAEAPPDLRFVYLDVAVGAVTDRLRERSGHFLPPMLMESRLATLERPGRDGTDVLTVAAGGLVHDIIGAISLRLAGRTECGARPHE